MSRRSLRLLAAMGVLQYAVVLVTAGILREPVTQWQLIVLTVYGIVLAVALVYDNY